MTPTLNPGRPGRSAITTKIIGRPILGGRVSHRKTGEFPGDLPLILPPELRGRGRHRRVTLADRVGRAARALSWMAVGAWAVGVMLGRHA